MRIHPHIIAIICCLLVVSSFQAFPEHCLSGRNSTACAFSQQSQLQNKYALHCSAGFYGDKCELKCPSACSSVHCNANDGTCIGWDEKNVLTHTAFNDAYEDLVACHCMAGFYGAKCDQRCSCTDGTWCTRSGKCATSTTRDNVLTKCPRLMYKEKKDKLVCTPVAQGYADKTSCLNYTKHEEWMPDMFLHNVQLACRVTPEEPSANCVRQYLQDRLEQFPRENRERLLHLKKELKANKISNLNYLGQLPSLFTDYVYRDHQEAYKTCCCIGKPAPKLGWHLISSVTWDKFFIDGGIRVLGSCHHTGLSYEW